MAKPIRLQISVKNKISGICVKIHGYSVSDKIEILIQGFKLGYTGR